MVTRIILLVCPVAIILVTCRIDTCRSQQGIISDPREERDHFGYKVDARPRPRPNWMRGVLSERRTRARRQQPDDPSGPEQVYSGSGYSQDMDRHDNEMDGARQDVVTAYGLVIRPRRYSVRGVNSTQHRAIKTSVLDPREWSSGAMAKNKADFSSVERTVLVTHNRTKEPQVNEALHDKLDETIEEVEPRLNESDSLGRLKREFNTASGLDLNDDYNSSYYDGTPAPAVQKRQIPAEFPPLIEALEPKRNVSQRQKRQLETVSGLDLNDDSNSSYHGTPKPFVHKRHVLGSPGSLPPLVPPVLIAETQNRSRQRRQAEAISATEISRIRQMNTTGQHAAIRARQANPTTPLHTDVIGSGVHSPRQHNYATQLKNLDDLEKANRHDEVVITREKRLTAALPKPMSAPFPMFSAERFAKTERPEDEDEDVKAGSSDDNEDTILPPENVLQASQVGVVTKREIGIIDHTTHTQFPLIIHRQNDTVVANGQEMPKEQRQRRAPQDTADTGSVDQHTGEGSPVSDQGTVIVSKRETVPLLPSADSITEAEFQANPFIPPPTSRERIQENPFVPDNFIPHGNIQENPFIPDTTIAPIRERRFQTNPAIAQQPATHLIPETRYQANPVAPSSDASKNTDFYVHPASATSIIQQQLAAARKRRAPQDTADDGSVANHTKWGSNVTEQGTIEVRAKRQTGPLSPTTQWIPDARDQTNPFIPASNVMINDYYSHGHNFLDAPAAKRLRKRQTEFLIPRRSYSERQKDLAQDYSEASPNYDPYEYNEAPKTIVTVTA